MNPHRLLCGAAGLLVALGAGAAVAQRSRLPDRLLEGRERPHLRLEDAPGRLRRVFDDGAQDDADTTVRSR